jgi:hypothetical protein
LLKSGGNLAIVSTRSGRAEHLDTAPQFCGLKEDHERFSRQMPLQTNCAAS